MTPTPPLVITGELPPIAEIIGSTPPVLPPVTRQDDDQ